MMSIVVLMRKDYIVVVVLRVWATRALMVPMMMLEMPMMLERVLVRKDQMMMAVLFVEAPMVSDFVCC
jgi:hypothetical protein